MKSIIRKLLLLVMIIAVVAVSCASCEYVDLAKDKINEIVGGILPEGEEKPDPENPDPEQPDPEQPDPEQPTPEQPTEPETYITYILATEIKNGDRVVIGAAAHGKALSVTKTGYYNIGVDYSADDFSNITENEIFVVSVDADGNYAFTSVSGKVIALAAEFSSLNEEGENSAWILEAKDGAEGVYYVKNAARGNYLEWYASKDNWSTYSTSNLSDLFEISFYVETEVEGTKPSTPSEPSKPEEEITVKPGDTITVAQAIALVGKTGANDRYYIAATVTSITNANYGAMIIADETGSISVYNSKNADGSVDYAAMQDKPYKGDTVLLYCTLQDFNGTPEIASAYIVEFEHAEININADDYELITIAAARDIADEQYVKVSGVVTRITYANGFIPSGFFLVDNTAAIYVYDGNIAARVKAGNTVTILGEKDHWILADETDNAAKFDYAGCNQITGAYLIENDELTTGEYDKSWITETTVKAIMDTPVSNDITTTIFKVTALVKKAPGNGFINYYIDDLDGFTGSYVYTQCNGNDFGWLDEFDGKICTVYLTVINAKSSASGCVWRFIPIEVVDEGYTFNTDDAAQFATDYYGVVAFGTPEYMVNAKIELPTAVSSELLDFENATISYVSSNTAVVAIIEEDGVLYATTLGAGKATVTVTGSYNGKTFERTVEITVSEVNENEYDTIGVSDAIAAENGAEITVIGIAGPSVVNQDGAFYLIDESGAIPVKGLTKEIMDGLSIGDKIIVKGKRSVTKDGGGQIVIADAEILANFYGNHDYSDASFITGKTMDEIKAIEDSAEATTQVFIVTASLKKTGNAYYSNYNLGGLTLYCSSANQYSWFEQFFTDNATEVTLTFELALCDWNAKGLKGAVLSVITEDGKVYNTLNYN